MTLPAIAEQIAERKKRQFDVPFKKQMEDLAVIYRSRFITNSLSKNPALKKYYAQAIIEDLEEVNKDECDELADCNCENVLRTKREIPQSIRVGTNPYDYVGSPGGMQPFGWTTFSSERYYTSNRFTATLPRYTKLNNRIYIFNEKNIQKVRIEDVFDDPRELANFSCSSVEFKPCYTNSSDFITDNAMAQLVIEAIVEKLNGDKEPEIEIKTDKNV